MALSASVEWEVDAATGADTNGGGFDASVVSPGTDYSYGAGQTVISWAGSGGTHTNDLASTQASGWLVLTSASRNFVAADVGNIINIQSGTNFTPGRYTIISVATNAATLDRACGTTGDASVGAGRLGGSLLTIGRAGEAHGSVGGQHIWVKYNASAYTAASSTSNVAGGRLTLAAGTAAAPTLLRGYQTTRGDETSSRPTFAWAVNASSNYIVTCGAACVIENIIFDGQRGAGYTNTRCMTFATLDFVRRCKVMSFNNIVLNGGTVACVDVEITDCSTGTNAIYSGGSTGGSFFGCYIHDNTCTNAAFTISTGVLTFSHCIIDTLTTGAGIATTSTCNLRVNHTTIYNTGSYGIDIQAAPNSVEMVSNHFQQTGNVAVNTAGIYPTVRMINCSFYSNTGGNYSTTNILARNRSGEVAVTDGDPLIDAAGGNFTPNTTALRGALLRATAFPTTFPGGGANYEDIGAVHHADPVIVTPVAGKIYSGQQVTSDGAALVTGTLHASNMHSVGGIAGSDLAAADLAQGKVVDDVTGTLVAGAGVPVFGGHVTRRA